MTILFYLGQTNIVADALSRKAVSVGSLSCILVSQRPLEWDIQSLANLMVHLNISDPVRILSFIEVRSSLF